MHMIEDLNPENVKELVDEVVNDKSLVHKVEACQFVSQYLSALRRHTDKIECFVCFFWMIVSNSSQDFDASNLRHFLWANLTNSVKYMTSLAAGTLELRVLWLCQRMGIFSDKEVLCFLLKLQESVRTSFSSVCVYLYFLDIIPKNYAPPSWLRCTIGVQIPETLIPIYNKLAGDKLLYPPNISDEVYAWHVRLAAGITSENMIVDVIKRDDVGSLMALAAKPGFDFNQRLSPSLFEPNSILQNSPTLGQVTVFFGATKCFKFITRCGIDYTLVDATGKTIVQYACYGGNTEILSTIERECGLDNCLGVATRSHNADVFFWLVESKGFVPGPYECCVACESDNELVAQYCLDHGVPVNYTDNEGRTLLHIATLNNSARVVKLLLSNPDIDVNRRATRVVAGINSDGPPVHFAAITESVSTLVLLLQDSRTDVNALDKVSFVLTMVTPLFILPLKLEAILLQSYCVNDRTFYLTCQIRTRGHHFILPPTPDTLLLWKPCITRALSTSTPQTY